MVHILKYLHGVDFTIIEVKIVHATNYIF